MSDKNHGRCHFGSLSGNPNKHCTRPAKKKWGDHWFCTYHGWRTPEAKQASIPCVTRLPEEPSCPSCERTRDKFREVDFCITMLQAQLIDIRKIAEKARSQHSAQGHHCELRSAIDSICDRADESLDNTIAASRFYNNAEHAEMDRLKAEIERTREIIAARLNQSVTNQKPEVADALREILEVIRIP